MKAHASEIDSLGFRSHSRFGTADKAEE